MIYLASPYSHPDRTIEQLRYKAAARVTAKLITRGQIVYSPIVHSHVLATEYGVPNTHEIWMPHCLAMLERADNLFVLMLDGWEQSKGVREELAWWTKHRSLRARKWLKIEELAA